MDSRFSIAVMDMGGWVRVYLGSGEPTGEVAKFLSHTLAKWFQERPNLRMQQIVPISSNGDTSELHAWYTPLPVHQVPHSNNFQSIGSY